MIEKNSISYPSTQHAPFFWNYDNIVRVKVAKNILVYKAIDKE